MITSPWPTPRASSAASCAPGGASDATVPRSPGAPGRPQPRPLGQGHPSRRPALARLGRRGGLRPVRPLAEVLFGLSPAAWLVPGILIVLVVARGGSGVLRWGGPTSARPTVPETMVG